MNGTQLVNGSPVAGSALLFSRVEYVGSRHEGREPRNDSFALVAFDGVARSAPALLVPLSIAPMSDEPPRIALNASCFALKEGEHVLLDDTAIRVEDLDEPRDALEFLVLSPPEYGNITTNLGDPLRGS